MALEDVLIGNPHAHSKADYYSRHLFLRVLCHELAAQGEPKSDGTHPNALGMVETSDKDADDEWENVNPLLVADDLNPILPTHVREASWKYGDRLRKLLVREKAVL